MVEDIIILLIVTFSFFFLVRPFAKKDKKREVKTCTDCTGCSCELKNKV